MLLHNTLQLADTWVNPFLRGHHISRHVLLCFPLVVLLWALDAQNRWVAWLYGAFLYASFPLSGTPLFRTNTFSAHTHAHTNPHNTRTCQHTHTHTIRHVHTDRQVYTCTHLVTQTLSHIHVALQWSLLRSFPEFSKSMLSLIRKLWTLWTEMDRLEKLRWGRTDAVPDVVTNVTGCFSVRNTLWSTSTVSIIF